MPAITRTKRKPSAATIAKRIAHFGPLKGGAHQPNGEGCVMEVVAFVAGEEWSDHPACACPVISAFLRSWNDVVAEDKREELLRPLIPRLINTKRDQAAEERRALMAADWLIRTHTPAWLRLAGLSASADALSALPEITAMAQIPSIRGPIEAARRDADAARAAARDAAGSAAGSAAWDGAWAAARDAAGSAAGSAAWDGAWDAAGSAAGSAAWDAAGSAAGSAAWAGAWAAARDAARDAAWDAAGSAAWDAAGSAAGSAAWDGAWAAAWAAARDAARYAAWDTAWIAAWDVLAPTVAELQASALGLVNRMIAVGG